MTDGEIERDRWQRPLVVPPEGGKPVPYTRATTFADCLDDKSNLAAWQCRNTAVGLMKRTDLQLGVASLDPDGSTEDKKTLNGIVELAQEAAGATAKRTIGSALHKYTEKVDRGEDLGPVPGNFMADLRAYEDTLRRYHIDVEQIEQFGVLDEYKIGGTKDRVLRLGDEPYIGDVKTGNVEYGQLKMAAQLAIYSRCLDYDHVTGQRTAPWAVSQTRGIIIHLPAGTGECHLHMIDLNVGWEAVGVAAKIRELRAKRHLMKPLVLAGERKAAREIAAVDRLAAEWRETGLAPDAWDLPTMADTALLNAIGAARSPEELLAIWNESKPIWGEAHTAAAAARKRVLLSTPGK